MKVLLLITSILYLVCTANAQSETQGKALQGIAVKVSAKQKILTNTVLVEAGSSKKLLVDIPKNSLVTFLIAVEEKDINVSVVAGNTKARPRKISSKDPFFFADHHDSSGTVAILLDNSYSITTPKTVYYEICTYNYDASQLTVNEADKAGIIGKIKEHMHIIQLCVEDYNVRHDGVYPVTVDEFKDLIPSSVVNPLDPNSPAVVYGISGKPGQVTYTYNLDTDIYHIYGFNSDGEKLTLHLTNE